MSIYLNKQNKKPFFSGLSQGSKEFRMACTVFAACTNAYYNGAIPHRPELDDIRDILQIQKLAGEYSDKDGAYLLHSAIAVAEYYGITLLTFKKTDKLLERAYELGYMVEVGISVTKEFYEDYKDGSIDKYQDYAKYQGDYFQHAFNIYKWKSRFLEEKGTNHDKEFIYDNYMGKEGRVNKIDVEVNEMKDIMYDTCYMLI